MTTNLLPLLLSRLHQAAPEMCDPITGRRAWAIGEYEFYFDLGDELMAQYAHIVVSGRPALAWLSDALMAAVEARGWEWEAAYRAKNNTDGPPDRVANIWLTVTILVHGEPASTLAEALLTALVAVAEAERVQ